MYCIYINYEVAPKSNNFASHYVQKSASKNIVLLTAAASNQFKLAKIN